LKGYIKKYPSNAPQMYTTSSNPCIKNAPFNCTTWSNPCGKCLL